MSSKRFVPKGAVCFDINYNGPAKDLHFLLLPKLTMLAFSAAIEPLRIANQITNKELYRWFLLTEDGKPVQCSNGIQITPDDALKNLPTSSMCFICSGIEPAQSISPRVLAWINRQRSYGGKFGAICTGAFALAKAGMLKNHKFTLHWENQPAFSEHFYDLHPTTNLYEIDNGLMTCGGGNAATDMMLDMIETDYGKDLAIIVSDMCIHFRSNNRKALQKSVYSVALSSRNQHLINAMQIMHDAIEEPQSIQSIIEKVGISRRQLERLFHKYVGESPVQFYIGLRVAHAHALLNETNMPIAEIAAATGFHSATHLSLRFKKRFGTSPTAFRRSWAEEGSSA